MAIKKCYRLQSDKSLMDYVPRDVADYLYEIDESYTTKRDWLKNAKEHLTWMNKRIDKDNQLTIEGVFGKCEYEGWCYCTECDEYFWADDGHECY